MGYGDTTRGRGLGGGDSAFGGSAPIHAPDAAQSLLVYLFSPIVEEHEVLDWELRASERTAAVAGVADTPAVRDIYANNAETAGLRISLLDPSGAAGNAWSFVRGVNAGALRFERVADLQIVRLAGEIFNNATTFGQILAAVNAVDFVSAEYFGGTVDATTVISSAILIPGAGGNFHGGVDGTPAVPEEAISATADAENRAILLRIRTTDTVGDIKPVVDAVEGLGSEYQGGIVDAAIASRALPWAEPFSLVTVVGGPPGPQGTLSAASRQEVEAARDAARAARDAALVSQQASEAARDTAVNARDEAGVDANTARLAKEAAADSSVAAEGFRDGAGERRDAAIASAMASADSAAAADADRIAAEAAQAAAEAARDAAQATAGFTAALTDAVTGNEETGIDVTVDANGKLNFVVTGGGAPPVVAHARYLALTTVDISTLGDAARAAAFVDDDYGASSDTEDITIPVFGENRYLTFTRRADLAAPTFIGVKNGQNQIGGFIQLAAALNVELGGAAQALWQHVDPNGEAEVVFPILSGEIWTIR